MSEVDIPHKAVLLEAGEAVPAPEVHTSGGTFAERKAAREAKAVEADEPDVENKAVTRKRAVKK